MGRGLREDFARSSTCSANSAMGNSLILQAVLLAQLEPSSTRAVKLKSAFVDWLQARSPGEEGIGRGEAPALEERADGALPPGSRRRAPECRSRRPPAAPPRPKPPPQAPPPRRQLRKLAAAFWPA